jgi:hypothetical protein
MSPFCGPPPPIMRDCMPPFWSSAAVPGAEIGSGSSSSSVGLPDRIQACSRSICSCTSELGCGTTRQAMPSG